MSSARTEAKLRVAIVQLNPKVEQVDQNLKNAVNLTNVLKKGTVDLVCLPEMVFTGYIFHSFQSLEPHLELPGFGPTSSFCATLARRLECHVIAGYPEKLLSDHEKVPVTVGGNEPVTVPIQLAGNSTCLFGPDGSMIGGYRKTNLYEADLPWAQAGTGFTFFDLPPPLYRLSIAICMDLNPNPISEWKNGDPPHELADFCIQNGVRLLVVPCAWKDSEENPDARLDKGTFNYWVSRLTPLWARDRGMTSSIGPAATDSESLKKTTVIICNRTGDERGTTFCGTSTVMQLERDSDAPDVIGVMKRREESCRVFTIDV